MMAPQITRRDRSKNAFERTAHNALHLSLKSEAQIDLMTDQIARGESTEAELQKALDAEIKKNLPMVGLSGVWLLKLGINQAMFAHGAGKLDFADGAEPKLPWFGVRVKVIGLVNAKQHNGCMGTVKNFTDIESARFAVQMDSGPLIKVRADNLQLVDTPPPMQPELDARDIPTEELDESEDPIQVMSGAMFSLISRGCASCGTPRAPGVGGAFSNLSECCRCTLVSYCSAECQLEGWRRGHRKSCCPLDVETATVTRTVRPAIDGSDHMILRYSLAMLDEFGAADTAMTVRAMQTVYRYISEAVEGAAQTTAVWVLTKRLNVITRLMGHFAQRAWRERSTAGKPFLEAAQADPTGELTVQFEGCQILHAVMQSGDSDEENDRFIEAVLKAGGLDAANEALRLYDDDERIVLHVFRIFGNASCVDAAVQAITDKERDGGSLAANTISVMDRQAESRDIQAAGLAALRNIATADCSRHMGKSINNVSGVVKGPQMVGSTEGAESEQSSVVAAGGVTATLRAMKRFDSDTDILGVACQVVLNTTNSGAAARWAMVEAGMVAHLLVLLERYHDKDVVLSPLVVTGHAAHLCDKIVNALCQLLNDLLACKQALSASFATIAIRAINERQKHPKRNDGARFEGRFFPAPQMGTPMPVAVLCCCTKVLNELNSFPTLRLKYQQQLLEADPELKAMTTAATLARRPNDKRICAEFLDNLKELQETLDKQVEELRKKPMKFEADRSAESRAAFVEEYGFDLDNDQITTQAQALDVLIKLTERCQTNVAQTMGASGQMLAASIALTTQPGADSSTSGAGSSGSADAADEVSSRLASHCALCGAEASSRCSKCKLVHYCCRKHQTAAWSVHKHRCGRALPTMKGVGAASVDELMGVLEEFGGADSSLVEACIRRLFELVHSKTQANEIEKIVESGALRKVLIAVLAAHRQVPSLQGIACGLLVFTEGSPEGIVAMRDALKAHPTDPSITLCACSYFTKFTTGSNRLNGSSAQRKLAELGVIGPLAAVLDLQNSALPRATMSYQLEKMKTDSLTFLSSLSEHGDAYVNSKLVGDGAIEAAVRYMLDESNDSEQREKAKFELVQMPCTVGDGHTPSDCIGLPKDCTPAMKHLGVSDPNHSVKLALAAGCPRKMWQELEFVHEMMERDGDDMDGDISL